MRIWQPYWDDYSFLLIWCIYSGIVLLSLLFLAFLISRKHPTFEKQTSYECGFEPFGSVIQFNFHAYIIALSFLIFDLELIYIYPWVLYWGILPIYSVFVVFGFLLIIFIGLIYEWSSGLLTIV